MEKVPAPGPRKRPQGNPEAKPTAKPSATRQPGERKPSSGANNPQVGSRAPQPPAATSPETVQEPTLEALPGAPSNTAEDATPGRIGGPRLSIPKLTLPRLSLPKLLLTREPVALTVAAAPVESEVVEAEEAEAEKAEAEEAEASAVEAEVVEADVADVADSQATIVTESPSSPEPDVVTAVAVRPKKTAVTRSARKRGSSLETILRVEGLTKVFDDKLAVNNIDLEVTAGSFYGIVGPNGAGKTTTLSMITGLLRPTSGSVSVHGADVWSDPVVAKRNMGVLPDRLRLFDRLTGAQLLYYAGVLRGMDRATVRSRAADLAHVFGLEESLPRLVSDYSAGMTKKVALAAAMIHSPRMLVLDEPFESVDPVSAATVTEILKSYVAGGGTVLLSSHSMDLVQRICDFVAVVVDGSVLADGTMDSVRGAGSLEERFIELAGGLEAVERLEWLSSFSD